MSTRESPSSAAVTVTVSGGRETGWVLTPAPPLPRLGRLRPSPDTTVSVTPELPIGIATRRDFWHRSLMDQANDEAPNRERIAMQLPIVEAFLWAADHADELLGVIASQPTLLDTRRVLTREPYGFSEWQVNHLLDLPLRNLSPERVALFREEAARLRDSEYRDPPPTTPIVATAIRADSAP